MVSVQQTAANIRDATPDEQKAFLKQSPPPPLNQSCAVVGRKDANVPDWYTPNSTAFMQLSDLFIAHATKLARCKRLPRGWEVDKPGEAFGRTLGAHRLLVSASDHGWIIERQEFLGPTSVLANRTWNFLVLCSTHAQAARLAEAAHRGLSDDYQLTWISMT